MCHTQHSNCCAKKLLLALKSKGNTKNLDCPLTTLGDFLVVGVLDPLGFGVQIVSLYFPV